MPRRPIEQITPTHKRILNSIRRLIDSGTPLTVSALVAELGLAGSTSLVPTLRIMQRLGYICIQGGGGRGRRQTIILTATGKSHVGLGGVPVLGSIPAGPLSEVLNQCETVLEDSTLLGRGPDDFLLVVDGDSMIGDGILPGDKVLLRPDVQVNNGEIAAVHIGDEYLATLKHVHFDPDNTLVTLKASNPKYEDVSIESDQVRIAGVYRGLIRNN